MPYLDETLASIDKSLKVLGNRRDVRSPSRYANVGASEDFVEHVAKGGDFTIEERGPIGHRGLALGLKALAEGTGSSGGYIVPVELSNEVMAIIRGRSAVMQLGPRIVPVRKELDVASLSTGAAASYVAENAQIPVSEQTFAVTALLRPRDLAAMVPVSLRLLRDAANNPSIEEIVRGDLAEVLALRADLAFIAGTGTNLEPLGIINTTGLTAAPNLGNNGATPSFDNLKDMLGALRAVNAPFWNPGWIFNPRLLSTLEKIKTTTGEYLADAGMLTYAPTGAGGTLLGYPFRTTTQISTGITKGTSSDTTYVVFSSDWEEAWIGENESLTIEASGVATYWDGAAWVSAFQNQQTVFRAVICHDFALRRPQLFTVLTGVRP